MQTDIVCYTLDGNPYQEVTTKDDKGRTVGVTNPMPARATVISLFDYNNIMNTREQQSRDAILAARTAATTTRNADNALIASALTKIQATASLTAQEMAAIQKRLGG